MKEIRKLNIALICGGKSSERAVSLSGAEGIKKALDPHKYTLSIYDPSKDLARLVNESSKIDMAFILLHGRYGEDGTIQGMLDLLEIPYQGSGVLGSALAMDKEMAKILYLQAGVPTPKWITVKKGEHIDCMEIASRIGLPVMVKPMTQGSSVGMTKVIDVKSLRDAIEQAWEYDDSVLVEEFITGRELTGGVIGLKKLTALPIVEIVPKKQYTFFNFEAKYKAGATDEICPANISGESTRKAQSIAIKCHRCLRLTGYSRTDMMLTKDGNIYAIETNTIPGMTPTSLFPMAAKAAGIPFSELLERLIDMALEERSTK